VTNPSLASSKTVLHIFRSPPLSPWLHRLPVLLDRERGCIREAPNNYTWFNMMPYMNTNRTVTEWFLEHTSMSDFLSADIFYLFWSLAMTVVFDQSVSTLLSSLASFDGSFSQLTLLALWGIAGIVLVIFHIVYLISAIASPRQSTPDE